MPDNHTSNPDSTSGQADSESAPLVPVRAEPVPAELTLAVQQKVTALLQSDPGVLVEEWLKARSPDSVRAYEGELRRFAAWLSERFGLVPPASAEHAASILAKMPAAEGNGLLLLWKNHLFDHGMAPATVARALAALRSLLRLAGTLGLCAWHPGIQGPKVKTYRDTRGPGDDVVFGLLEQAADDERSLGRRDFAIITLLALMALRRGEVANLDVGDLEEDGRLWVKPKGSREKVLLQVAAEVVSALKDWMAVHPSRMPESPMFIRMDRQGSGQRLSGSGIYRMLKVRGRELGLGDAAPEFDRLHPHGMRHWSITQVAMESGGDVIAAQQHGRHASPVVTMRYIDNLDSKQAEAARLMGSLFRRKRRGKVGQPRAADQQATLPDTNQQEKP